MTSEQKELEAARRLAKQRSEASARYLAKQETITIHVDPEIKAQMQAAAQKQGISMKKFIVKKCLEK